VKIILFVLLSAVFLTDCWSQTISASPNPFPIRTVLSYTVPVQDTITIEVLNALGESKLTLYSQKPLSPGVYQDTLKLDQQPEGIYFLYYRRKAGGQQILKMVKTGSVGLEDNGGASLMTVYPNPLSAASVLYIKLGQHGNSGEGVISLFDLEGKKLMTEEIKAAVVHEMNLSVYPAGVYFLQLKTAKGIISTTRIIKY
jgi:hypothetical protein